MSTKQTEALKLALETFEADASNENFLVLKHCVREALARTVMMDQTAHDKQRKPLTDEEIVKITSDPCLYIRGGDYRIDIARAIEAVHGIIGEQK